MTTIQETMRDPRLQDALAIDRLRALRLLMVVRLAVSATIMVYLLLTFPNATGVYWAGLTLGFGLFGVVQHVVAKSRFSAPWQAYVFVALDLVIVTFIILFPNPFFAEPFPPAQQLRYPNFDYLYVVVALLALGASPWVAAWSGVVAVLAWGVAVAFIVAQPGIITESDIAGFESLPLLKRVEIAGRPDFVDIGARIQEFFLMLVFAFVLAAMAYRTRRLLGRHMRAERARANLSRYFSPGLIEELADQDEPLATVRAQDVAVLFADIVGFTALSEKQPPERVIGLLRDFHGRMAREVFAHAGTVDKYIGDAIMATFGTPRPGERDATNALACAHAMLAAVETWNEARTLAGADPVKVGIGLHFGPAVMGDIGDEKRLEYAVVGDTVNVASRLEAMTRKVAAPLVVSDEVVAAVKREGGDGAPLEGLKRGRATTVRGRAGKVDVWTLASAGAGTGGA